uniref:ANIS5_cation-bd domain-containing protein n=1 Tax=Panagrellus redivivus TaxID=6233 RepID=A0A7E4VFJ2_PANRE
MGQRYKSRGWNRGKGMINIGIMIRGTSLIVFGVFAVVGVFAGHDLLPQPTFLSGMDQSAVQSFQAIAFNQSLSRDQKNSELQQWANGQSSDVQTAFNAWQQNTTSTIASLVAQADNTVTNLSSGAQALYNQIRSVVTNNDLTGVDLCSQIRSDISNADRSALRELKQAVPMAAMAIGQCYYGQNGNRGRRGAGYQGSQNGANNNYGNGTPNPNQNSPNGYQYDQNNYNGNENPQRYGRGAGYGSSTPGPNGYQNDQVDNNQNGNRGQRGAGYQGSQNGALSNDYGYNGSPNANQNSPNGYQYDQGTYNGNGYQNQPRYGRGAGYGTTPVPVTLSNA